MSIDVVPSLRTPTAPAPVAARVPSLVNLRDLGGIPGRAGQQVRAGQVWRSDDPGRVAVHDRPELTSLGLRTVIDLRTATERQRTAAAGHVIDAAEVHHHPVLERTWDEDGHRPDDGESAASFLAGRYLAMLDDGGPQLAAALATMAASDGPVVVHCAVGKDRTGVLIALLLAVLGTPDEVIVEDYARSGPNLVRMLSVLAVEQPDVAAAVADHPPEYLEAPPEAMVAFLDGVRARGGSGVGLVRSLGTPIEVIETLHHRLLV